MRKFMIAATALMAAFVGGSLGAEPARATPALAGIAVPAQATDTSNVTPAQYRGRGYRRGYRGYRRGYRGGYRGYRRGFYARPFYGRSRVVCRTRFGYYGPRRVCYRR